MLNEAPSENPNPAEEMISRVSLEISSANSVDPLRLARSSNFCAKEIEWRVKMECMALRDDSLKAEFAMDRISFQ